VNKKERARRTGSIPYFGATGQVGWIDDFLFDQGLVLLGEDGAPFFDKSKSIAYLVSGKSWVNNHAHVLAARTGVSTNTYIKYFLDNLDFRPFVNGTTRLKLTQGSLRSIPVSCPPLPEQHRIVAEIEKQFTRLDAAVAALKRVRTNARRYRASVLKAACEGRLVPTEAELAKQEGRDYEPAAKLLERILTERRTGWEAAQQAKMTARGKPPKDDKWKAKYKEPLSASPDIQVPLPGGWEWCSLGQLLVSLRNGIARKPDAGEGLPILRISAVRPLLVDLDDVRHLPSKFATEYADYQVKTGDLLFTRYNGNPSLVGVCGVVRNVRRGTLHPDKLIRGVLVAQLCAPHFVEVAVNAGVSRQFIARRVRTTAGQSGVSGADLKVVPIPLPPLAEQHRIVAEVERRLSRLDALEAAVALALKRAERLRAAILKRAFSGQLVPQDPNDQPASALLTRIRAERAAQQRTAKPNRRRHGKRKSATPQTASAAPNSGG